MCDCLYVTVHTQDRQSYATVHSLLRYGSHTHFLPGLVHSSYIPNSLDYWYQCENSPEHATWFLNGHSCFLPGSASAMLCEAQRTLRFSWYPPWHSSFVCVGGPTGTALKV